MEWLVAELVAPYFCLQLLMAVRYRGRWRLAALAPLLVVVPLAIHASVAYAAGSPAWPAPVIVAAPFGLLYLLLVGIVKAVPGR